MVSNKPIVTITGVTGYLGSSVLNTFIKEAGERYTIRATVRDKANEQKMKPLKDFFGEEIFNSIEFVNAELTDKDSIDKAIEGSTFVVHTASPVDLRNPRDEMEFITPAVNGVLFVMEAARKYKVKRVVITSSVAATSYRTPETQPERYDETHWSNHLINVTYAKSKTLAEQAAWNFLKEIPEGEHKPELVTLLPALIVGPNVGG